MTVHLSDNQANIVAEILTGVLAEMKEDMEGEDSHFHDPDYSYRNELIEIANAFGANIDWDTLESSDL